MYGGELVQTEDQDEWILRLDEKKVLINRLELNATCEDDPVLEESINHSIHRLYGAIMPIPTQEII